MIFRIRAGLVAALSLVVASLVGYVSEARAAVAVTCSEFPITVSFSNFNGQNVGTVTVNFVSGSGPSYSASITKYKLRWVGSGSNNASEYTFATFVNATSGGPHTFSSIPNGNLNKGKTYQFFLDPYADTSNRAAAACVGSSAAVINTSSTKLAVTQSASSSVASGAAFGTVPKVAIQDSTSATVTDDATPVTVAVSGGDGLASLVGTTTVTPTTGVATFTGLGLNGTDGQSYTLTFTAGALTSTTQTSISVTTGAAASISIVEGNNQRAAASSSVSTQPKVKVVDSGNNVVSGVTVEFAVASGSGSVGSSSVSTNGSGFAATSWTLGRVGGTNTITATSTGLTNSPLTFTATGTHTLRYSGNRGVGSISSQTAAPGETITLSAGGAVNRGGFTLLGWNTSPFGTGTTYSLGDAAFSMPSRNVTLYAVWAGTLNFDLKGGSAVGGGAIPSVTQAPGNVTLPSAQRPGKTLVGWTTRSNGTGQLYLAGTSFYLGIVNATLYAKWS